MSSRSTILRNSGIHTLPSDSKLNEICEDVYKWLEDNEIIKSRSDFYCPHCEKHGIKSKCSSAGAKSQQLKCNRKGCRKKVSRLNGTFFAGCSIGIDNALRIVIYTVAGYSHKQIMQRLKLSNVTVTNYMRNSREMCIQMINEEDLIYYWGRKC